jgi:Holliday junction resolvasome RuvABC endonuclease subunit
VARRSRAARPTSPDEDGMKKLVTLDLGGHLGVSIGPLSAEARSSQVKCLTIRMKDTTSIGPWLASGTEEIHQLVRDNLDAEWAVEKVNTAGRSAYFAIRKNMCLLGHIYFILNHYGITRMQEVPATQGKVRLAGNGNADKDQMQAAAKAKGYSAKNEHEADACGIREVVIFGPAETKSQRQKREAHTRKLAKQRAKEAAKGPALL